MYQSYTSPSWPAAVETSHRLKQPGVSEAMAAATSGTVIPIRRTLMSASSLLSQMSPRAAAARIAARS